MCRTSMLLKVRWLHARLGFVGPSCWTAFGCCPSLHEHDDEERTAISRMRVTMLPHPDIEQVLCNGRP
jgi:hypothetical protein